MSGIEKSNQHKRDLRNAVMTLASLEDEEAELMKMYNAIAEGDPLSPHKKQRRSPCVWAFKRYGCFWEKDVPQNSDAFFKESFRVEREHFNTLLKELQGLKKKDTNFRIAIPLDKRIGIALYTLGSSAESRTIGSLFGVSAPMVKTWEIVEDERPQPEQTNCSNDNDDHPETIRKAISEYIKTKL